MRLWSISPEYLDRKGLLAVWREGLLARAVLMGQTRGYRNHPQLDRFKAHEHPSDAINYFLEIIYDEALRRNYRFDRSKIELGLHPALISVTSGQLEFETAHLRDKLARRDPARLSQLPDKLQLHPLFVLIPGSIAPWEKTS
jgi:hypothetical protein